MTGKDLLEYLKKCTPEQLQTGLFVEVFVDDDDGGHIETKKIWSCRYTDSIFDTDWTTYQGPKKGFNFKY